MTSLLSFHRCFPPVLLPLIFTLFVTGGCSAVDTTKLQSMLGIQPDLITIAYTLAEDLERRAYPPLIPQNPSRPIVMTTFVNNNNLEETSRFSRILQEHLTSRFVQMGYNVRELKLRKELLVEPRSGEKMLSRNLSDLDASQPAQAISVGTYTLTNKHIYIAARLIHPDNNSIVASVDRKLPMDKDMMAMFGLHPKKQELMDPIPPPRGSFMTWLLY